MNYITLLITTKLTLSTKHRCSHDLVAAILSLVAKKGKLGLTRIMYHSFLSYRYVTRFLTIAKEAGLLDYDKTTRLYKISRKGREYLKSYAKIESLVTLKKTGASSFLISLFYVLQFSFDSLIDLV